MVIIASCANAQSSMSSLHGSRKVFIQVFFDYDASVGQILILDAEKMRSALKQALIENLNAQGIAIAGYVDPKMIYPSDTLVLTLSVDIMPAPGQVVSDLVMLESFRYMKTEASPKVPMWIQCTRSVAHGGYSASLFADGLHTQVNSVCEQFSSLYLQYQ